MEWQPAHHAQTRFAADQYPEYWYPREEYLNTVRISSTFNNCVPLLLHPKFSSTPAHDYYLYLTLAPLLQDKLEFISGPMLMISDLMGLKFIRVQKMHSWT